MERTKKKNMAAAVLLAIVMILSSASVVFGFGSYSSPDAKSIHKTQGDDATKEKYQKNSNGGWSPWDSNSDALKVKSEYTNIIKQNRKKAEKSTLHEISEDRSYSDFWGGFHQYESGKYRRDTKMPSGINTNDYFILNLGESGEFGEPYVMYENYRWFDSEANDGRGKWIDLDVKVSVKNATPAPRETPGYRAFTDKGMTYPGGVRYDFSKEQTGEGFKNRILFLSKNLKGGFPHVEIVNIGNLRLNTEYFKAGTDTRVNIKSNVTYADIDACQAMSFQTDKLDYTYTYPTTELCYAQDKKGIGGQQTDTVYDTYTTKETRAQEPDDPKYAVGFCYNGTWFSTVYTSNQKKPVLKEEDGHYVVDEKVGEEDLGNPNGNESYFAASAYPPGVPELKGPSKYVFDADEPNKDKSWKDIVTDDDLDNVENTLDKPSQNFTYVISQRIPPGYGDPYKLTKFEIGDELDDCLEFKNEEANPHIYVKRDTADDFSEFVSNKDENWDVSTTGNKIKITAKDKLLSGDSKNLLYDNGEGSEIRVAMQVRIKDSVTVDDLKAHKHISDDSPYITFKNKAYTKARSTNQHIFEGNGNQPGDGMQTNTVTTKVTLPKPGKTAPEKLVSDDDTHATLTGTGTEKRVEQNTIETAKDVYTYHVKHRLGNGVNTLVFKDEGAEESDTYLNSWVYTPYWYFNSYKISDDLNGTPVIVSGNNVKVYEYSWSKANRDPAESTRHDVTNKFDISVSGDKKQVSATAKSSALSESDFYNVKMYELEFKAEIDKSKYDSEDSLKPWAIDNNVIPGSKNVLLKWPNKAKVNVRDREDTLALNDPEKYYPKTLTPEQVRERASGNWEKETNEVNTHLWIPIPGGDDPDPKDPGILLEKSTVPYEFQVGEEIPYTIKIKHNNENAVAYDVVAEDTDFPAGFHIIDKALDDGKTFTAELENENPERERRGEFKCDFEKVPQSGEKGEGFKLNTEFLFPGEEIVVKFIAKADKTINGTVVPNTAIARAWGANDKEDKDGWNKAGTSVYINSPKINITKTMDKEPDENGNINVNSHTPITFKSEITNVNPGTFMRNLYVYDVFETDGIKVSPKDVTVTYIDSKGRKTDLEEFDDAYVIQTINKNEAASLGKKNYNEKLGSKPMDEYEIKTSDEEAKNTGDQLSKANYGGFLIKFLGKYRNLGYAVPDAQKYSVPTVPAATDDRGSEATYLAEEMETVEEEQEEYGSSAYTTDYADLNLQGRLIITYKAYAEEDGLKDIRNFIKVPATENTNNVFINNDDDLFTEGEPKVASGGDFARTKLDIPVKATHTKDIKESKYAEGDTLHYTVKSENKGTELIKNVVLSDVFTTRNAVYDQDSFSIKIKDKEIKDKCEFEFAEDNMSVVIKTNSDLPAGETITMTYTAKAGAEGDKIHNESTFEAENAPELKAEKEIQKGDGEGGKSPKTTSTHKGKKVSYESFYKNNEDETWRDIFFEDEITTKNAKYNNDFKVWIDDEEITSSCKVTIDDDKFKAKVETGRDLPKGKTIKTTYSVTALDSEEINNQIVYKDPEHVSDLYKAKVPPVEHEKDVEEAEHDGPEGIRSNLHYTITTKHNGKERPIKNPVIKDDVYSKNMTYGDINIYRAEGKAPGDIKIEEMKKLTVGEDYSIDISEEKMSFEIKLKDDLKPGDIIKTLYTAHVKDLNQVDNRTTFTAEGVDEIIDDEHVPGPEIGDKVTVYKSSDPVTETKVNGGDTITYILKAVNSGGQTVKYTHIRDYIPEGTIFDSVQNDGAFVKDKNYVEWVVKDLKPGEKNAKTVTFKVKVNIENTPEHIYNHGLFEKKDTAPGNPGSIKDDPKQKTEYTHHFTEEPSEDEKRTNLTAVKSCDPTSGSEVRAGDNIKYFIKLENKGNKDADNAGIRDYIPEGTQFVSAGQSGKFNDKKNYVDWNDLKVEHGKSITVDFTVKVLDSAKKTGRVENQALYQDQWTDPEKDPSSKTNIVEHYLKMVEKDALTNSSQKGKNIAYTGIFTNNKEKPVINVRIVDTIKSRNAKYNNDFTVYINNKETKDFTSEINGYTATVKLKDPVAPKAVVKLTYSVKAENNQSIINDLVEIDDDGQSEPDEEEVPGIEHTKDVKEGQHDGPKGQINTLHYTLNSKNNGKHEIKNVVITDIVISKNLVYNKDIKVIFDGTDITSQCKISYTEYGFRIETAKNLPAGKTIRTTYSGKVTNKNIVSNETVLTADGIDGIKDQEHVPGPEDGVYVTTRKTAEPPSGTVVKEGQEITYILTATNTGKDISKFTQIRDYIPKGTTFKSVQDGGAFVKDKNYCEWVIKGLKPNESKKVRFTVTVNKDAPLEIWNVAYYRTYPEDPGKPGKIPVDPDKRTEETVHYTNEDHPKHVLLRAIKSCDPAAGNTVKAGQLVVYSITLENYGDKDTTTAGIRDYIPKGTQFVSAKNKGKYIKEKNCVDWMNLSIKAKQSITVSFTVKVTKAALKKGSIENQALYQNDWKDPSKNPSSSTNIVAHKVKKAAKKTTPVKKGSHKDTKKAHDKTKTKKAKATKPKTGDSFMPQIAGIIMIIAALLGMLVLFAVERKK